MSTLGKYSFLLKEFSEREDKILTSYDIRLQEYLGLKQKQVERLLNELSIEYNNVQEIKQGRKKAYKLIQPIDILAEALDDTNNIGWLFNMVYDADPDAFRELEKFREQKNDIYKFFNTPFEDINSLESKDIFKKLKRAIKNREYAKIKFFNDDTIYDNLKCLKLVFIDNNWYITYIDEENILKFGRISFIERVDYATKINSYQESKIEKQIEFLNNNIQNAMTLYGVENRKAKLKATGFIAKYFEDGMKKFMPSQTFIKKLDDGSIIFTINYTQDLEILPFVQKWLPDLIILEPQELKDAYLKKLQTAIANQK